jgi:predicted O-methyltransferase YrrM
MDIVFVDAGHTYAYIKSDTENALKMVRPGGVVLWHDYMQVLHPDVTRYLYELSHHHEIYHLRSTNLALCRAGD